MPRPFIEKLITVLAAAFLLNWAWESLHSFLYVHYQGGAITQLVLLRAALFDAIVITLLYFAFLKWEFLQKRIWLTLPIGFIFAIVLEWWALGTSRWTYNELMPIIPIIGTGLTPTIQLGLISYFIFKTVKF